MGTLEALPRSFPTAAWRLPRPGPVDAVGLEARAGGLASLSLEGETERQALDVALAAFELEAREASALELCAKALRPDPHDPGVGPVAAVSTAAALAPTCRKRLAGTGVRVSVESDGPDDSGADEVTVRFDHASLLAGRHLAAHAALADLRDAGRTLKVVADPDALGTYDALRRATLVAIAAGADFVGARTAGELPAAALCVLEAIRDVAADTGLAVGFLALGRPVEHVVLVHETLGRTWLTPERLRIAGPADLLDDLLVRRSTNRSGVFGAADRFPVCR